MIPLTRVNETFVDSLNFNSNKTIIVAQGIGDSSDCKNCCYLGKGDCKSVKFPSPTKMNCSSTTRPDQLDVYYKIRLPYYDKNGKIVESGSIIDLHQTVNGQSKFVVLSLYPLDIRYAYDLSKKYEYDSKELLTPDEYSNVEFEILGSLKISLVIEGEIVNTFDYKTITI